VKPELILSKTLLPVLLKLTFLTLQKSIKPQSIELDQSKGVFFAFWHGKMIVGWQLALYLFPGKTPLAIVSQSKDGEILANALEKLQFRLIRGSSSKGKEIIKSDSEAALKKGSLIAITPDGPRGPIETLKYGFIRMASETSTPIVFASIQYKNAWVFSKSWDRFQIPKPFSKATIKLTCIKVPQFKSEDELKSYTDQLSTTLKSPVE
jgi:hypothetical protein